MLSAISHHSLKSSMDNGQQLRSFIENASVTQASVLELFNKGQARPLSIGQWKAYLAHVDSKRRSPCPDLVLQRVKMLLKVS